MIDFKDMFAVTHRALRISGYSQFDALAGRKRSVLTDEQVQKLGTRGINFADVAGAVRRLDDGTMAIGDRRVVIYIRDVRYISNNDDQLSKIHVSECSTIEGMRNSGRYERYVVATGDDGKFSINRTTGTGRLIEEKVDLRVCLNCIDRIGWRRVLGTDAHGQTNLQLAFKFTLKQFFSVFQQIRITDLPESTEMWSPVDAYPANWNQISSNKKMRAGWKCSQCWMAVQDTDLKRLLHVHHVNGVLRDVRESNLKVLCYACHADEPAHQHMRGTPEYQMCVKLRTTQRAVFAS